MGKRTGRRAVGGQCFPWAMDYITKHPDALLMQGKVRVPLSSPPQWYWHGWIVHKGRVKDWQTMVSGETPRFKKDGWPIPLWMEMHTPRDVEEYGREEAWAACHAAGTHAGPWHGPLSVGEKQPSAFVPSWANRGRRAASDPKVTAGELQFYRGGDGALRSGPAYFTSGEWLAKMYGPVTKHRLYLRNPKFVTDAEWGGFDSISLRLDPSSAHRLRSEGYDSAVWIKDTAQGLLYNVYALAGTNAIKKPKGGSSSIQAAFQAALEAENWADDAEQLRLLRRVAKRLNLDVKGLTVYQPDRGDRFRELYNDSGKRVWYGRADNAVEVKAEYIEGLIRAKLDESWGR